MSSSNVQPRRDGGHPDVALSNSGPKFFNEKQVAQMWNISLKSLQNWRVKGGGPRFHKFGTAVRYSLVDLERFEAQCVQENTSQAA